MARNKWRSIPAAIRHNLRCFMEKHDIAANVLAERADLGPTAVYDILNGKSKNPRAKTIEALSGVFLTDAASFASQFYSDSSGGFVDWDHLNMGSDAISQEDLLDLKTFEGQRGRIVESSSIAPEGVEDLLLEANMNLPRVIPHGGGDRYLLPAAPAPTVAEPKTALGHLKLNLSQMGLQNGVPIMKVTDYGHGAFKFIPRPIESVPRPQGLRSMTEVFAFYNHGFEGYPRFKPGELIVVSLTRPPQAGDDVVIFYNHLNQNTVEDEGEESFHKTPFNLIEIGKLSTRGEDGALVLEGSYYEQIDDLNPEEDIKIWKILNINEILGL